MYWGADDEVRADADDPKRRLRQMGAALAVTVLSIGGTVAMASASTTHASAAPPVATAAPAPDDSFPPKPLPTTTTTAPPPAPAPAPAPAPPPPAPKAQAVATAVQTRSTVPAAPAVAGSDTCSAALAYLGAHSAPGFTFECPGYALGHQAMTCVNVAGVCPGAKLIVISTVCPASYMNEAHNSWVLTGLSSGGIDPYGYCH